MNNLLNLKLNLCVYRNGLNENYQHHNGQVEQMQLSDVWLVRQWQYYATKITDHTQLNSTLECVMDVQY